jgi:hypothetical protein
VVGALVEFTVTHFLHYRFTVSDTNPWTQMHDHQNILHTRTLNDFEFDSRNLDKLTAVIVWDLWVVLITQNLVG